MGFRTMIKRGFSAIESLIALVFFSFVVLSAFEFFGLTRSLFFKLKKTEEETLAVMAALDKARIDLCHAGYNLVDPIRIGTIQGVLNDTLSLIIYSSEQSLSLFENPGAGVSRLFVESTEGLSSGREICLFDGQKGEKKLVASFEDKAILLSSPLELSYQAAETRVLLLEKVTFYLDGRNGILRRKVNSSSPQPLLEDVHSFDFDFEKESNLVRLRLALKSDEEKRYEMVIFPKNTGLCLAPS